MAPLGGWRWGKSQQELWGPPDSPGTALILYTQGEGWKPNDQEAPFISIQVTWDFLFSVGSGWVLLIRGLEEDGEVQLTSQCMMKGVF